MTVLYTVSPGAIIYAADHNSIYNTFKGTGSGENLQVMYRGADIASGATLTLGTDGNYFHVTGTTTITAISALPRGTEIVLEFDGALTLTYNATSLILFGAANYTTVAGDVFRFASEDGTNWREVSRLTAASVAGFTNPMTTAFDLIYAGTAGAATRLPVSGSTVNMTLSTASSNGMMAWRYPWNSGALVPSLFNYNYVASTNGNVLWGTGPYQALGDIAYGGAGGAITRLAVVASTGNALSVASTNGNLAWSSGFTNPMTTLGDLIVGGASGVVTRFPIVPSTANYLSVASTNGNLAWVAIVSGNTTANNSISGDVAMTNAGSFYDGPSMALASGTWFVSGHVSMHGNAVGQGHFNAKMWNGTAAAYASGQETSAAASNDRRTISLSSVVAVPVGTTMTVKISATSSQAGMVMDQLTFDYSLPNASQISAVKTA